MNSSLTIRELRWKRPLVAPPLLKDARSEMKMKRWSAQPAESGYSLIEALVVIAIVGAISIVTVPNFMQMYQSSKVKAAVRQFASDLRGARQLAVTNNTRTMVSMGTTAAEKHRYWIYEEVGGAWQLRIPASGKQLEPESNQPTVYFAQVANGFTDTQSSDGRADIIFLSNGTILDTVANPFPSSPFTTVKTDLSIPRNSYTFRFALSGSVRAE